MYSSDMFPPERAPQGRGQFLKDRYVCLCVCVLQTPDLRQGPAGLQRSRKSDNRHSLPSRMEAISTLAAIAAAAASGVGEVGPEEGEVVTTARM